MFHVIFQVICFGVCCVNIKIGNGIGFTGALDAGGTGRSQVRGLCSLLQHRYPADTLKNYSTAHLFKRADDLALSYFSAGLSVFRVDFHPRFHFISGQLQGVSSQVQSLSKSTSKEAPCVHLREPKYHISQEPFLPLSEVPWL